MVTRPAFFTGAGSGNRLNLVSMSVKIRFIGTASTMFPPVCNDASHSGIDQVAIGTMAIQAFVAAKEVVDAMAMIFNGLDQSLFQHGMKTFIENAIKRRNVPLG